MDGTAPPPGKKRDLGKLFVWLGLVAFFGVIQASTDRMAGNDTYYHIKYAWLIWHEGALWDFRWLEGTFFRDMWVDKELLYHLLLIPFTLFGDLYIGAKAAAAFYGGTAIFVAYLFIRSFGEAGSRWQKHAWMFALLLAVSSKTMLYRLSTTRVPAASVAFMMIGVWLMHRRAARGLFVLGFFYAWMYHVSVVLVPFAVFFAIAQRIESGRWDVKPTFAVGLGIVAGFIINPYFPDTLPVLFKHVIQVGLGSTGLPKGSEWAAYDTWYMAQTTNLAWAAAVAGVIAIGGTRRFMSGRTLALLLCAGLMTAAFFKARRFVEYFPVFAVVFSASAIHDLVSDPESWWPRLKAALGPKLLWLQVALTLTLAGFGADNNWRASREAAQNAWPWRFAGAAKWLEENTPEGSQVYNAQWDVFPELIFHNHHNSWTLGLDPNFTYFLEPRLYYLSSRLGNGQVPEGGRYVKEGFGCDYAVASKNSGFAKTSRFSHSGLEKVFEDEHATVLKVFEPKSVLTVEGELWTVETQPEAARCAHREPKGGMGNASARGYLQCTTSESQLVLRYRIQVPKPGTWRVEARFLTGPTPAKAAVSVGGRDVGSEVSLESDSTRIGRLHRLGEVEIGAEPTFIEVRFEGPLRDHPINFGLDYVRLRAKG